MIITRFTRILTVKKVSTVTRKIIEKDGMYFKDIDGTGEVSKVNDWRLPAEERAKAYVDALTLGYDKDQYMPDSLKDENGKAYAYRDTAGNYYEMNFGLTY